MGRQNVIEQELSRHGVAPLILHGNRLALLWSGAGVLFLLQLALFALAIPAYYQQLAAPPDAVRAALAGSGISIRMYAAYLTLVIALFSLGCFAVSVLIFWRRRTSGIALVASLLLVLMGSVNAPAASALESRFPMLTPDVESSVVLLLMTMMVFLFVFPSGRFVPAWTQLPVFMLCAATLALGATVGVYRGGDTDWYYLVFVLGCVLGIWAQVYRYLRVSSPAQRQQTKWVVLGLAGAIVGQVVVNLIAPYVPPALSPPEFHNTPYDLLSVTGVTLSYSLVPLAIGAAVVRYHLFGLDVVINRSLVYGLLTLGVAGIYVLTVGALGTLLQSQGNLLVSLVGVGLVAALFAPLRDRLQLVVNRLMYGERDDPYAVLSQLGQRLEAAFAPDAVLPAIVETVARTLALPYAAIALRRGDEYTIAAEYGSRHREPLYLPLIHQGETVGQLVVGPRGGEESFTSVDCRLLRDLALQAGIAVHAVRLTAELQSANDGLREAREHLVTSREEERRRLRRDLHDGLGPQFAGFTLRLDAARNLLREDPDAADRLLEGLSQNAQGAVSEIRRLVYALRPPALDDLGLAAALRQHAAQYAPTGLHVSIEAPDSLPPLPAAVEVAAYRITQEALANVARHSGAGSCKLRISLDDSALYLEVEDHGRGLPAERRSGVGLQSMRERAEELGGVCVVESAPSGGTSVRVRLPLSNGERRG